MYSTCLAAEHMTGLSKHKRSTVTLGYMQDTKSPTYQLVQASGRISQIPATCEASHVATTAPTSPGKPVVGSPRFFSAHQSQHWPATHSGVECHNLQSGAFACCRLCMTEQRASADAPGMTGSLAHEQLHHRGCASRPALAGQRHTQFAEHFPGTLNAWCPAACPALKESVSANGFASQDNQRMRCPVGSLTAVDGSRTSVLV